MLEFLIGFLSGSNYGEAQGLRYFLTRWTLVEAPGL